LFVQGSGLEGDFFSVAEKRKSHAKFLIFKAYTLKCFILHNYSETSLNQPALGPKNMAGLEGWPFLVRLVQRIVRQGLKKIGRYSGRASFLRSGLEKFHCTH
jgi:hypothetical protein